MCGYSPPFLRSCVGLPGRRPPDRARDSLHLLHRVKDRGVVSLEMLADLGQGEVGELPAQVHRDLAAENERLTSAWAQHVFDGEAVRGGGCPDDRVRPEAGPTPLVTMSRSTRSAVSRSISRRLRADPR